MGYGGLFIIGTVLISSAAAVLQTDPDIVRSWGEAFDWIEIAATLIFTVEYIVRFVLAGGHRSPKLAARYTVSVGALIDLASLVPFYLNLLFGIDLVALVVLRLFRLLKLIRYFESLRLLGKVLHSEMKTLLSIALILFILIVAVSAGMFILERSDQPEAFGTIPRAMWWSVVTLTTLGYGDVVPVTAAGRVFASVITVLSIGTVALPAGILASRFSEELERRRRKFQRLAAERRPQDGYCERTSADLIETAREDIGISGEEALELIEEVEEEAQEQEQDRCAQCGSPIGGMGRGSRDSSPS